MSLVQRQQKLRTRLVLPPGSAEEAALVPDAEVFRAQHLLDVVQQFLPPSSDPPPEPSEGWARMATTTPTAPPRYADLADVKGQAGVKRVLEIAAAGGHSLLMVGPPGSGKSMLAQRFAGLLPPMAIEDALESAAIASLAGRFELARWAQRPTGQPHHSASAVALVGGGSPPRPGEISLAHHGVLFLDELPEFPRAALEALREPLETGTITIARAARRAEFPARFQLIAAMNPCPCGYLGSPVRACRCSPDHISRYQGKLSGPLLDRIDLHIEVPSLPAHELINAPPGESTEAIAARSTAARQRALARQGCPNADLQGQAIDMQTPLEDAAKAMLQKVAAKLGWSGRSTHRSLKVARTIADLAGCDTIGATHVAEAVQYRRVLHAP
jgi:magnesium chelatase family protein